MGQLMIVDCRASCKVDFAVVNQQDDYFDNMGNFWMSNECLTVDRGVA
jgi:hypothetical protein